MQSHVRAVCALAVLLGGAAVLRAEVLIRWDHEQIPLAESLGIRTVVVPAASSAMRAAFAAGYRVYVEVEASTLSSFVPPAGIAGVVVKGKASPAQLRMLRQAVKTPAARVVALDTRGKWPHIRSNWVTKHKEGVLQVTGRSAQPWIENNAALLRIARTEAPGTTPLLMYAWQPITLSDVDEGPALENYLVAIAEAGSFGGDLLLPLHQNFQKRLLLGEPQARAEWDEIRRSMQFHAWVPVGRYRPIANIGVVTANPTLWFEVLNLLMRHNLPFELIAPADLTSRPWDRLKLLVVLDSPGAVERKALDAFEKNGGVVKVATEPGDPDRFALQVRQWLGRSHRLVDIWNGITVLTAAYVEPGGSNALLTVLNYAHQSLPVQLRVAGTYSQVLYESPEQPATLLTFQHRDGYTEFVIPALRIGGRVFLSHGSSRLP